MRYFEIDFDNAPRNQDDWDGDCVGKCSICILGERTPTIQEAAEFCRKDMEEMGYEYVVNVKEISREEARTFIDKEDEGRVPVFV